MTLPSIVEQASDYKPETVKSRARAVLLLAVERMGDRLADTANELTLNELSQATSSLGRIAGIADAERDSQVQIVITRDHAPASLREVAPANSLPLADIAENAPAISGVDAHTRLLPSASRDDESA